MSQPEVQGRDVMEHSPDQHGEHDRLRASTEHVALYVESSEGFEVEVVVGD